MNDFISLAELERGIDAGKLVLVEALPEPHYARGHLPGAVLLPLDALGKDAARVLPERDADIVVYCTGPTCANSDTAGRALRAMGYEQVRVFKGGKTEWTEAGHSLEVA
jgi:rhodanese-related sulfurtransferase